MIARDVLHGAPVAKVDADITALAEASLEVALASVAPKVPFAVIALGRFAGGELSYASDLDVVLAYEGTTPADFEEATRTAMGLRRFVDGATPAERIWDLDLDLRPEGKQGPFAALARRLRQVLPPVGAGLGAPGDGPGPAGGGRP